MSNQFEQDNFFMARCLQLAALGELYTAPNPMVGAVIVFENRIIGEGWHKQLGGPHAEVNAVNSVSLQNRHLLSESTIYVSLEPCNHHGKTPPCTDLLLKERFKRVVIGSVDDNPLVGGAGITRLINAGIEVKTGVLEEECRQLNKKFFVAHQLKRPFITLKWAQTADFFMGGKDKMPIAISTALTKRFTHRLRANHMGILVGWKTIFHDKPQLDNRLWAGKSPQVIVLDPQAKLSADNLKENWWRIVLKSKKSRLNDIEIGVSFDLEMTLSTIAQCGIQSILVEGGAETLQNFLLSGLWDELITYTSNRVLGEGISAPKAEGFLQETFQLDKDQIQIYRRL